MISLLRKYHLISLFSFLFLFIFLTSCFLLLVPTVHAQEQPRYVTCDSCGYCPAVTNATPENPTSSCEPNETHPVPGNWVRCARCVYSSLFPAGSTPDPLKCETLRIDPNTNMPPPVTKGRQYTALGCIAATGGFGSTTGAPSFIQAILDLLVFRIAGGLAFLYLMYGAFIVLTSQADPERLNYGRRVIYGAIIGLIFTLSSVFITNLIGSGILKIPGFGK